jgi:hypothetical protein
VTVSREHEDGCPSAQTQFLSHSPVQHRPPPVARSLADQVEGGDGCLRMPVSRLGRSVDRYASHGGDLGAALNPALKRDLWDIHLAGVG